MQADPNVIVMGEDVGKDGGVFRATVGLLDKFGPERVLDTPFAESMIGGLAIGMAVQWIKASGRISIYGIYLSGT